MLEEFMMIGRQLSDPQTFVWLVRLLIAGLCGGLIGFERGASGQAAGLRTNMLVAVASCYFTLLSIDGFPLKGSAQDTARIAAQVVTGIGFLGAGVLIQTRDKAKGLTTATTVWLVGAIGMGIGAGQYVTALFTTAIALVILRLLYSLSHRLGS